MLYKIPADVTGLPEGLPREKTLKTPAGAVQGVNSFGKDNWAIAARCRPGPRHAPLPLQALCPRKAGISPPGVDKKTLLAEIRDHVLAQGELIGTYQR